MEESPLRDPLLPTADGVYDETLKPLRAATSDSASLLQGIPGVSLQGAGGVSSLPVVHGLADDRLRIKVDGMDLISACGNHMNPPLSYIDPSRVESATVFAGIAPVSRGGDSLGGTILVDSAPPAFADSGDKLLTTGEAGVSYQSNGDGLRGHVAATVAGEKLSLGYQGSTAQAEDYRAGADFKAAGAAAAGRDVLDGDEVGSTMFKSSNHAGTLGLKLDDHLLTLKAGLQRIPYQGWPNQRMDMTRNDSEQQNLLYEGTFGWGKLDARGYHEHTRHAMQFYDDKLYWYGPNNIAPNGDGIPGVPSAGMNGVAAGMPMDTEGQNYGLTIQGDIPLSPRNRLRLGGEWQDYTLNDWWDPSGKGMWPDTFVNINDGERDRRAAFAEWEAQWNPALLTQLGMRYERVSMNAGVVQGYNTSSAQYAQESAAFNAAERRKEDDNIDVTALLRWIPQPTSAIEIGVARKTRSPNLYERYAWSTGGMAMRMINLVGDGNGYVGNLNLEPEVAHSISATFDWHDANRSSWNVKVTPYYTHIDDYIDAQRCVSVNSNCGAANQAATAAFVYLQYVNQSAHLQGIDVSGSYLLAADSAYGDFTLSGLLGYVRGVNDTTDDDLYNMMPLNGKLGLEQRKGSFSNTLEWELVGGKTHVSSVRNEVETAGYGLLHYRGSYQWKQISFDYGVKNILDQFYNPPLGGAYVGQGKTMSDTGVAWGVPVPGPGRSVYLGMTVTF
ncbi:MAG: TonB-dependent receptor [Magnetococcus sp. WYHC-3]